MTPCDQAAPIESVRERVRQAVERGWREPATVLRLDRVDLRYRVRDRHRDGRAKERYDRRWSFLVGIAVILDAPRELVGLALEPLFDRVGFSGSVRGDAGCAALPLADAAQRVRRDLWLAWSSAHLDLVRASGSQKPKRLWSATDDARPRLVVGKKVVLSWPDGSRVRLPVTGEEARLLEVAR